MGELDLEEVDAFVHLVASPSYNIQLLTHLHIHVHSADHGSGACIRRLTRCHWQCSLLGGDSKTDSLVQELVILLLPADCDPRNFPTDFPFSLELRHVLFLWLDWRFLPPTSCQ